MDRKETHALFLFSILLKGIHSAIEIFLGLIFLFISPVFFIVPKVLLFITQDEITEDPNDVFANTLINIAHNFSISSPTFLSLYLLSHGIVKLFLIIALLNKKLWAYPWTIGVLFVFIAYQLYRFTHTHSTWLIVLSVIDLIVIYFVWKEYKYITPHLKNSYRHS